MMELGIVFAGTLTALVVFELTKKLRSRLWADFLSWRRERKHRAFMRERAERFRVR